MKKKHIAISLAVLAAVLLVGGCSADGGNSSSIAETTPVSTTNTPETTTTTASNETKKPETTTSTVTTKAPETTTVTTTTTKGPEWTEEKVSGTKYISETCYSRKKAVIGSDAIKQYFMGDSVKVTAKTNTGYFKLDNGEFIHGDYLSDTKVEPPKQMTPEEFDNAMNSKDETTPSSTKAPDTNYGYTNSGDKILGYNGDGYAIIGYMPDGGEYVGKGKDEFGEYWIITYIDGKPMKQYKENGVIGKDDTSLDFE